MKLRNAPPLVSVAMLVSGCISFQQLSPTEAFKSNDAIVLIGVSPRARISIQEGKSEDGWKCTGFMNAANIWPENGFVVLKLPARIEERNYGMTQILPNGIGGEAYRPAIGVLVPAFHAPPGKVTFAGAIKIVETRRGMHDYTIVRDDSVSIDAAKEYLVKNFPKLPQDIEFDPLVLEKMSSECM